MYEEAEVRGGRELVTSCACACARAIVLEHVEVPEAGAALDAAERWAAGKATPKEVRAAIDALDAAEDTDAAGTVSATAHVAIVSDHDGKPKKGVVVEQAMIAFSTMVDAIYDVRGLPFSPENIAGVRDELLPKCIAILRERIDAAPAAKAKASAKPKAPAKTKR